MMGQLPSSSLSGGFVKPMDQQTGQLINLFDFRQPIIDVYCGQLPNESARFL